MRVPCAWLVGERAIAHQTQGVCPLQPGEIELMVCTIGEVGEEVFRPCPIRYPEGHLKLTAIKNRRCEVCIHPILLMPVVCVYRLERGHGDEAVEASILDEYTVVVVCVNAVYQ